MTRQLPALLLLCSMLAASPALAWDAARLEVPVVVNGFTIPYPELAIFVLPDSPITVSLGEGGGPAAVRFLGRDAEAADGDLRAPAEPGLELLEIRNPSNDEICRINVFTMFPASRVDRAARLNGYRIGEYPQEALRGLAIYRPPKGFVEVTPENRDTRVSPNFTLGEFLAKQASEFPKYLVLRTSLLLKLELILASLNESGRRTDDFVIMSGYRTPFYNRAIGNVPYSRHVYGGAADFYIDESPADGRMDDLNGDGKVDRNDARWLAGFVNDLSQRGAFGTDIGGIGIYGSTSAHGPFVHVDVRGTRARW